MCLGNHDARDSFRVVFPEAGVTAQGHVQQVHDIGPLRLIVLDTLEEGRHGGAFCTDRARWLADRLGEAPDRPTVLILHHPPVETGIPWMTIGASEPWVDRLRDAIAGHDQVVAMLCGHIHRSLVTRWGGTTLAVCSSTAPQVALELAAIDPDTPDNRPMILADAPGYALHYWNGAHLVTHFATAAEHVALARYDVNMQPLVRHLLEERGAS
jgi:3',5'-cyclic AMP phosphodiesterase CpdA